MNCCFVLAAKSLGRMVIFLTRKIIGKKPIMVTHNVCTGPIFVSKTPPIAGPTSLDILKFKTVTAIIEESCSLLPSLAANAILNG